MTFRTCATAFASFLILLNLSCANQPDRIKREIIDLNGTWEIAQGTMNQIPDNFDHEVQVPGLVDMSQPSFQDIGFESDLREAFWYRKTFKVEKAIPGVATLKIHKAKYGSKVFLNGKELGEHLPNFTPGYLDVTDYLKEQSEENTIIIRIGANRTSNPVHIPDGWDFEKIRYIPGIYDNVEVILSGSPHIVRIQVVPDISNHSILVQSVIKNVQAKTSDQINFVIKEKLSGKVVGSGHSEIIDLDTEEETTIQTTISIEDVHLWSPEDPFLYELEASTSSDELTTTFGMRSFEFKDGFAYLNGQKYFMRGSNVTIYRFFEDPDRAYLPWDKEWVKSLHEKFKEMNWNSLRYCIGFPPDFWYDIADEVGFLIQDEFPIWYLWEHGKFYVPERSPTVEAEIAIQRRELEAIPEDNLVERWNKERRITLLIEKTKGFKNLNVEEMTREFTDWMNERVNHPSVVLWDAQNETDTEKTAQTIRAVRHLDLSNRPWDNGWRDQEEGETYEAHPYYMRNYDISELATMSGDPTEHPEDLYNKWRPNTHNKAFIINEYAWLWLNRDGSTTTLTDDVYKRELGENSTTEERLELYINYLSSLSEYFRCHRKCAGILHFCGLGYSRPEHPRGQTSDHFIDIRNLQFEPLFAEQVKDAFSPLGLMINFWDKEVLPGNRSYEVYVINDLYEDWEGSIELRVESGSQIVSKASQTAKIGSLGKEILDFNIQIPEGSGRYRLIAALINHSGDEVKSTRFFNVK